VIDGATNGVIATVPVGDGPFALCYDPTDNKVYSANRNGSYVTVVDGATNGVITVVPTGDYPFALCYNATNDKVYCANALSDDVTVIDAATDFALSTIEVGASPVDLAWNPVQNRVYVANFGGSSISVLRDSGGAAIEESPKPQAGCKPLPTVIRGVLVLGAAGSRQNTEYGADLLDISGRRVLDLSPGANDVGRLSPGVYFVREKGGESSEESTAGNRPSAITKVVIAR
jgi:YVTN family beta-propeller protein